MLAETLRILAINFAIVISAVVLIWLLSIRLRDVSIIDLFFSGVLLLVTAVSYWAGSGAPIRQQVILALVGVWAVRMTVHLVRRNWGHGEDPRYAKLRTWVKSDREFVWLSLKKVFLLQGVVIWFAALPVQVAQVLPTPAMLGWPAYLGITLCLIGLFFETVADWQLTTFRANPANSGRVLNTGLWRYSRHPNYFGELSFWWGLFLIACDNPWAILTVIGPLLYSHLVINITGQATLDKKLARERPGYRDYMESTSGLIPLPPKQR